MDLEKLMELAARVKHAWARASDAERNVAGAQVRLAECRKDQVAVEQQLYKLLGPGDREQRLEAMLRKIIDVAPMNTRAGEFTAALAEARSLLLNPNPSTPTPNPDHRKLILNPRRRADHAL